MTDFTIDVSSYNKAAVFSQRHGYQMRGTTPTSIVIHSTNGARGSAFNAEAHFLFESADVSAHFLVGKDGRIVQFLDPKIHQAWHAGLSLSDFMNSRSIGIENHHAVGEAWTDAQFAALTWLVRRLMAQFAIPARMIDTHRAIALPKGRKSDPNDWSDHDFYAWRAALETPAPTPTQRYKVKGVPVYQRKDRTGPVAGWLPTGQDVIVDKVYEDGTVHLASGLGFADGNALEDS